ncbi:MAG: hypothetical protein ACJ746_14435 [Bryobacteraceae bacterium]
MILPASTGAVFFLCLLVFLALGSWVLPWRLGAARLRFEIFAIDFALGGFLLAVVAAFTLGSMGSELAFTDSLLVSGHRAQASVLAAGLITGIANVALIASASLGGVAPAFSVAGAVGAVIFALISGVHDPTHLTTGTVLALATIVLVATVAVVGRSATATRSKPGAKVPQVADYGRKSLALAVLSGLALAAAAELAYYGTSGELGVAPYAAFVFVCLPALLSTLAATFFLFNFPLQGARLHANTYFSTKFTQHLVCIFSGVIWGAGVLGCLLLRNAPADESTGRGFAIYSAFGSFVLAAAWGLSLAAQPERLRARRGKIAAAAAILAVAMYFLGYAVVH